MDASRRQKSARRENQTEGWPSRRRVATSQWPKQRRGDDTLGVGRQHPVPSDAGCESIWFKDFKAELFVAPQLSDPNSCDRPSTSLYTTVPSGSAMAKCSTNL